MKYDVITIGGATEDITFYTKEGILIDNKKDVLRQKLLAFEYGAKIKIDSTNSYFGGGAANAAVCFNRLGFRSAAAVCVGDDQRGSRIKDNFRKNKVGLDLIETAKGKETGFSFILVGPGCEHIVFSNRGANSELKVRSKRLKTFKWIYLSSLSGDWQENLTEIFKLKSVKISWNPGHRQILAGYGKLKGFLAKTDVLILNLDEATELVMSHPDFKKKPAAFFKEAGHLLSVIKSWGVGIVLITAGEKGAYSFDGKKFYRQSAQKVKDKVNTTGVGDAFGSSFVAGLEAFNGDISKSLKLAALNSASVVAHFGAQTGLLKMKVSAKGGSASG
jgi:sugar/nucleoside kinase (ribokinase family)